MSPLVAGALAAMASACGPSPAPHRALATPTSLASPSSSAAARAPDLTRTPPPSSCASYPAWTTCRGPSCVEGRCVGADLERDLGCRGDACCEAAWTPGVPIAITADPSPLVSDAATRINRALACAASRPGGATLVFAPGRYLLRTPLRAGGDDLTLLGGDPGADDRAVLLVDPCNPEQRPAAIQAGDRPIARLSIRGFRIELTDGPRIPPSDPRATSTSGIQLNHCSGCTVEDVEMVYTGAEAASCKPYNLDGITFALGSSGAIRRARVRGVPKVGIYLAGGAAPTGPIVVEDSEVLGCDGPLGATGISIVAPDVTVRGTWSHHNGRHPFPATAELPEQGSGLSIGVMAGAGGALPWVPRRVRIERSRFDDNAGDGVLVGSAAPPSRPEGLTLTDVEARRNGVNGVRIDAGEDVVLTRVEVSGNGYHGILISGEGRPLFAPEARLGAITIRDALVHDNGAQARFQADPAHPLILPGIGIAHAASVAIDGGRFFRSPGAPGTQFVAVGVYGASPGEGRRVRFVGAAARQAEAPPRGARIHFEVPAP